MFVSHITTNNLEAFLCLIDLLSCITVALGLDSAEFIPLFSLADAAEWFSNVTPWAVNWFHGGNGCCQGFYSICLTLSELFCLVVTQESPGGKHPSLSFQPLCNS